MIEGSSASRVIRTAISLERELFEQGEATALRLGLTRSGLCATALREFLERRENEELARSLEEAYGDGITDEEQEQLRAASASFRRMIERDQ